jgi:hypothetical protein
VELLIVFVLGMATGPGVFILGVIFGTHIERRIVEGETARAARKKAQFGVLSDGGRQEGGMDE